MRWLEIMCERQVGFSLPDFILFLLCVAEVILFAASYENAISFGKELKAEAIGMNVAENVVISGESKQIKVFGFIPYLLDFSFRKVSIEHSGIHSGSSAARQHCFPVH